jgi:serine/threonine protein phosphatase PrpC
MNIPDVDYSVLSRTGRRSTNEDKALCLVRGSRDADNRVVLAVADGMGGLEAGDIASKTVYEQLVRLFQEGLSNDFQQTTRNVETYIKTANRSIYEWSQQKRGTQVGTTVSSAVIIGNRCLVFNIGDSRIYIIRAGEIRQVTKDHSIDWQSYDAGHIKKEQIGKSHYSNALTRAVGTDPDVAVDIFPRERFHELKKGDILFSCTDGLWNKVTDAEINYVFNQSKNIKKSLETLYKLAYKKGSKDNISMAVYRYNGYDEGTGVDTKEIPMAPLPGKKAPKPNEPKKKIDILKTLLIGSIGSFLAVAIVILVSLFGFNQVKGGVIHFIKQRSSYPDKVMVRLSYEPLRLLQGGVIDSDIYYTLDGSNPSKNNSRSRIYMIGELIGFVKVASYTLKARVISKGGRYKGGIYSKTYVITSLKQRESRRGIIKFVPEGGKFSKEITVLLSIAEPLKSSKGEVIDADIYYTIDGSEPKRNNGRKYMTGELICLEQKGKCTVKARLISKLGGLEGKVYTQTYALQPAAVLQPITQYKKSQNIVTDFKLLDLQTQDDIKKYTNRIVIEVEGIIRINRNSDLKFMLSISKTGQAKMLDISGFTVEPLEKMKEIKFKLNQKVQGIPFAAPTSKGKPVDVEAWLGFNKIATFYEKVIIER